MSRPPSSSRDPRLDECLSTDRSHLLRRLRRLGGAGDGETRRRLEADIDASIKRQLARLARRPTITYPEDLPIAKRRGEIAEALRQNQVIVVCGETGSGKSTQLPKICIDVGRGTSGLIGHTQPRRIAARTIAARIAEELETPLGEAVGYTVRFRDHTRAETFIKVMTDGILLAELGRDRRLEAYDTIIIDEAHERSLNIDFLLGYLKQLLPRRRDLKLVITSATIDPDRFSAHFDDAPVIEVSGRLHPVDIQYRPLPGDPDLRDRGLTPAILAAVDEIDAFGPGDVLVFLAGEREIREAAEALRKHHPPHTEILPLYARLSIEEQNRVFKPHPGRRIVLATNVAETSLTVPGIRYVVDPGLARISRYSPRSRVQRLPVEAIAQASARQRAGRCGRLGPGVCVRLYSEEDYEKREAFTAPEILRTNLASVILQMTALGLGDVESFPFLEPPKRNMIRDGRDTLHELGALDAHGKLTEIGRRLSRLPIDPRLGRMILAALDEGCLTEILVIASALSVQDPRERPIDKRDAADAAHRAIGGEGSDFLGLLALWEFYHERKKHLSWNKLRAACRTNYLSFVRMREWHDIHAQLRTIVTELGSKPNQEPAEPDAVHRAVLTGLLRNIGMRGERREFEGTRGGHFHVFPGSNLFKKPPLWVMAAEVVETTRRYARTVAPIRPEWIERLAPHLVQQHHSSPRWDMRTARVIADERVTLWGLELVSARRVDYGAIDRVAARELFIHHALVEGEWDTSIPPLVKNRELIETVRREEAKHRRRDLLVHPQAQYEFYDQRVPADVCTGRAFDQWWRQLARKEPARLDMTRADVVRDDAQTPDPALFPETITTPAGVLPLTYALEPGSGGDGVTLTVPLAHIAQLAERELEWLVPGLLEEKIVAMIRTLPKAIRRFLVPAPDHARECAQQLRFGHGDLAEQVATMLGQLGGVEVAASDFNMSALPEHLRLRVCVVDDADADVDAGRDLQALQNDLAQESRVAFSASATTMSKENVVAWDFDDLPERIELDGGIVGFPALVERADGQVDLTVFPDAASADAAHRTGVRRLLLRARRDEILFQLDYLPNLAEARLLYTPLGSSDALTEAIAHQIVDRVFLAGREVPRTAEAYERRLVESWSELGHVSAEIMVTVVELLRVRQELETKLAAMTKQIWTYVVADVRARLDRLVPPDVVRVTSPDVFVHLPRYVGALARRLEKLPGGGLERDHRWMQELAPLWTQYVERRERQRERGIVDPALARYRWMYEELCVATYAQELGTAEPVSEKRLRKQWEMVVVA